MYKLTPEDWKLAPKWANYFAVDSNGSGNWYEYEPDFIEDMCEYDSNGWWESEGMEEHYKYVEEEINDAIDTLTARPKENK